MREIKFRAWNSKKNFVTYHTTVVNPGRLSLMIYFGLKDMDGAFIVPGMSYIDEETVIMQFTGLKDKNGKEVYEGDIVKTEEKIGVISWGDFEYATNEVVEWLQAGYVIRTDPSKPDIEVIGNIYENPELLK